MTLRTLTEAEFHAAVELDASAFGLDVSDEVTEQLSLPALRSGRVIGEVLDDGRLASMGMIVPRELTLPGGATPTVATVTWVSVSPDQQRRGRLRDLMRHQLHGLHDDGAEPIAILTASEAGIYGRFGYGMAVEKAAISVPSGTRLRADLPLDPVREPPLGEAGEHLRAVYERVRPTRVGYLSRADVTWSALLNDLPQVRGGDGPMRVVTHPDGYATFRVKEDSDDRGPHNVVLVRQFCAATAAAQASLWHHLINRGLVREVRCRHYGVDEVLRDLVVDPRAVTVRTSDNTWVRLVDLDRAVPLRGYRGAVDVVLEVEDSFCPWNAGRWRFTVAGGVGAVSRTDDVADLRLGIAELGACFLGGVALSRLAAAGSVVGDGAIVDALDDVLTTNRAPYTPEIF